MFGDESRTLRTRHAATVSEVDRLPSDDAAGSESAVLVTSMVSEYPTTAQAYYACTMSDPTGDEVEGGGSLIPGDGTVFALNVGGGIPPVGSRVVACSVGGRWVFAWNDEE